MKTEQKLRLAWIAVPFLFFIAYHFGFRKTIQQYHLFIEAKTSHDQFESFKKEEDALKNKKRVLTAYLDSLNLENTSLENHLVRDLSEITKAHSVKIVTFENGVESERDGITILTTPLTLEGDFNGLVSTLYELESGNALGLPVSLHFEKYFHRKSRKSVLQAHLLLERPR